MRLILVLFVCFLLVAGIHCKRENHPEKTKTSATVCEGKSHKISCQGKQKIEITASDYGRTSKEVCPSFFNLNTNCHSENALKITKKECDGYKECTLHANNDEYGEPCFGTSKYLTVSYKCVKTKANYLEKVRVCEGNQQSINCPGRRKIDIEFANYGRLKGGHFCGILAWDKDCKAANSLSIVKSDCQGKRSCVLKANNDKFGDPCFLTQKYLEVHYRCRK